MNLYPFRLLKAGLIARYPPVGAFLLVEVVLTVHHLGEQLLVLVEQCLELHHQRPVLLLQLRVQRTQHLTAATSVGH